MGVTAIWLMPFQPSPCKDDGYDVADYYGVDPRYGTLGDFVEFTQGCRQRGHAGADRPGGEPYFERASVVSGGATRSEIEVSRLVCVVKEKAEECGSGVVFPGVQKSTWNYDEAAKAYYFHRFYDFQPDLNTANPEVQAEILKIMGFWLQLGVSGFRMDAVPFVISEKGAEIAKPQEQYEMLRTFSQFLTWREGGRDHPGEANVLPDTDMEYFGSFGERLQMMFNFEVNQHLFLALASGDAGPLMKAMRLPSRGRRRRSGDSFCVTMTSWTSGVLRKAASSGVCGLWSGTEYAAVRSRYSAAPRAHAAGRPEAAGTCLQPDDDPARHPGDSLRRRDRHG